LRHSLHCPQTCYFQRFPWILALDKTIGLRPTLLLGLVGKMYFGPSINKSSISIH
jgi:hypothetical protein